MTGRLASEHCKVSGRNGHRGPVPPDSGNAAARVLFASASSWLLGARAPKKQPTDGQAAPYECGIVPSIEPPPRFPVRFYLVAMIFIIFDIEIVFLYPWAVDLQQIQTFGLVEVVIFAAVVFVSFLYPRPERRPDLGAAPRRCESAHAARATSESTIAAHQWGTPGPR